MTLIQLLAWRQKMPGDTFGKTLFGVYLYSEMGEEEFANKRYTLRKFMGGLHAAYLYPAS